MFSSDVAVKGSVSISIHFKLLPLTPDLSFHHHRGRRRGIMNELKIEE